MGLTSGRATFSRFKVEGDPPLAVDQALIDRAAEARFHESPHGTPDEVETGWCGGDHLLDMQFSYEKNGFGDMLLLGMRMDTHRIPAEVKKAYRLMHEQAAAASNPTGFATRQQKREAADMAGQQIHEDLVAGRFRRSRLVPVLWDLRRGWVYSSASVNAVTEALMGLFRRTFELELTAMTAGALATHLVHQRGHTRDIEDMRPSPFTPPPHQARSRADDAEPQHENTTPTVPWAFGGIDSRDFIGNEWLIWLWYLCENEEGLVKVPGGADGRERELAITLFKSLEMECAWDASGRQTLKAHAPTQLPEAAEALAEGKWPRKTGMIVADTEGGEGEQFELTLQADRLQVSAALLPMLEDAETPREVTEHRLQQVRHLTDTLDRLMEAFLQRRTGSGWPTLRGHIRSWIAHRQRQRSHSPAASPSPATPSSDPAPTPEPEPAGATLKLASGEG